MASYSVAPVKAVSSLPEPLDMAQAATLNGELPCSHNSHCSFCTSADSFLPDETMCEIQSLDSDFVCIGAYETAYHALVHCGRVQQGRCDRHLNFESEHRMGGDYSLLGELALVHGATGATGLAAVQVQLYWGDTKNATSC